MPTLRLAVVCLILFFPSAVWAEPDVDRLMEWLGISAAVRQVDRIIDQNLALSDDSSPAEQPGSGQHSNKQALRQKLVAATGASALLANTRAYIAQHLPIVSTRAEAILAEPMAVRARNFDVAMEMAGSFDKFQAFLQQLKENPVSEQRLLLIQRLDTALRTSAIAALLQTEIETTSHLLMARLNDNHASVQDAWLNDSRQQQRRQHMADMASKLNLFSYRFMKDEELTQYVELLEDSSIQALLRVSEQGLLQGLEAGRAMALQ